MKQNLLLLCSSFSLLSFGQAPVATNTANCNLAYLLTVENFDVYKQNTSNVIMFKAKMSIDADGSPRAYGPNNSGLDYTANAGSPGNWYGVVTDANGNPVIQSNTDPYPGMYVSPTTLYKSGYANSNPLRYTNSEVVPFYVLPNSVKTQGNITIGDVAYVYNTTNGLGQFAIFADGGPSGKLGEASIYLANSIGVNSNARNGGTPLGIIEYIIFPGSGFGQGKIPTNSQIDSIGSVRINAMGGYSITNCLNTSTTAATNDYCGNAIQLNSGTNCNYTRATLQGATTSFTVKPSCDLFSGASAKKDIFFFFIASNTTSTIEVKPTVISSSAVDAVISLYSGTSCTTLNEVGCTGGNGGGAGTTKKIMATNLTIGQKYWVRIYDYGSVDPTDDQFDICLTTPSISTELYNIEQPHNNIKLYPNPTSDLFSVDIMQLNDAEINYIITNFLQQVTQTGIINKNKTTLNLTEQPKGIYFLTLSLNNYNYTYKIIKL